MENAIKLRFALTEEQAAGFPVSFESIWCVEEGSHFRVKNAPFFVDGISFDDLVDVHPFDAESVILDHVVEPSKNSTVWINFSDHTQSRPVVEELLAIGCGVEGGVFPGYFSVNVPMSVCIDKVYEVLDPKIDANILEVNYPSVRHGL